MDLAIDEVHQISTIIQEEAGDEAEIIFGAVHDPELEGQIRVTVIATGFDDMIRPNFGGQTRSPLPHRQVQPRPQVAAVGGGIGECGSASSTAGAGCDAGTDRRAGRSDVHPPADGLIH